MKKMARFNLGQWHHMQQSFTMTSRMFHFNNASREEKHVREARCTASQQAILIVSTAKAMRCTQRQKDSIGILTLHHWHNQKHTSEDTVTDLYVSIKAAKTKPTLNALLLQTDHTFYQWSPHACILTYTVTFATSTSFTLIQLYTN